jgi:hypothetical protein
VLFWAAVVIVLALMWFSPYLRRGRAPQAGPPGRTEGATENALLEAERARGRAGWGSGDGGSGGGGY